MKDTFNHATAKARQLSKDLLPDAAGINRSTGMAIDLGSRTASEVIRLGKDVLRSDLAKEAGAAAAVGALIAVPLPLVGPVAGAVVGASLGFYKYFMRGVGPAVRPQNVAEPVVVDVVAVSSSADRFEALNKLHELKVNGVLTDEEFTTEKKKILDR